ncbi:MAG: VOC family protein, partial [Methanospirillum sp.]|uniref:VOC family protein n=1 Tax=Methanospirillum sp. TaxID=45200 RepID=UPI0023695E7B
YQELFGLTIELAIEGLTTFKEGISLWQQSIASDLMYNGADPSLPQERPGQEIYFETDDIDGFCDQIKKRQVKLFHEIQKTPWQQRTIRFSDPDGHMIEVGESMEEVIRRISREGHTPQEVATLTFMPEEIIKTILNQG